MFGTVIRKAVTLCRADAGQMWRFHGEHYRFGCSFGGSPAYDELLSTLRLFPQRDSFVGKVALELRSVQLPDVLEDPDCPCPR